MLLEIKRYFYYSEFTMGLLMLDGVFQCFTLELPRTFEGRENVPNLTCIPSGVFGGKVLASPKHPDGAPHILGVPGRDAIEIHIGNFPRDVKGCAVVGDYASPLFGTVGSSTAAFHRVMAQLPKDHPFAVIVSDVPTAASTAQGGMRQ